MKMDKVEETSISIFEKLLYHNQFILGPFFVEALPSWKRIKINNSIYLTIHPDLNACQAVYENKSITLIGLILDPENPEADDSDIIGGLIRKLSDCDNFMACTYKFGGRWILIVDDGGEVRLFNDATGLRQVFYTEILYAGDLWCASQPGILAEILNLEMDGDAIDFINSYEFRKHKEYRWPGHSSPYRGIKHMLPNHYLNLETGRCKRYWPDKPLRYLPIDEAIEKISHTLQGLMKSVSNRFDLALSITAGWDSRLVLAASKEIKDKISYMTVRQSGMPESHPDIIIPSLLLSRLGLKHDVVKSNYVMNGEFARTFYKSVILAHDVYAPDAQAILNYYSQHKVAVTGSVSEIARWSVRAELKKSKKEEITAGDLSILQKMGKNQYALNCFKDWLSGLGEIYNVHILDLFDWEQGHGNWLATCQLEFDSAWKDIFTPFNCRKLLITMLSVEEKYRKPPKYKLYEKLILNLWPEVLTVPINPHYKKTFYSRVASYIPYPIKSRLKKILKKESQ